MIIKSLVTKDKNATKNSDFLIWGHEIASLRQDNSCTHVSFGSEDLSKPRLITIEKNTLLDAIDARLGTYNPMGNGYYIAIPLSKLKLTPKQTTTIISTRIPGDKDGIFYQIEKVGSQVEKYQITRFGLTKTAPLKKLFDTEIQARSYLRTTLKAKV